jgi:uncharacterized protein DUF4159/FHA domain-containing protein
MASLIAPDGSSIDLPGEALIGRGQTPTGPLPLIDIGGFEGGLTVSRRHARIRHADGDWFLHVEPDARNSTLVDDRLVPLGAEVRLDDQSFIRLGNVVLMFRHAAAVGDESDVEPLPEPAPPAAPQGWTGRLSPGPATAAAIAAGPFKRINPFRGLMVDETVWRDAHRYHLLRGRIDLLLAHGAGIVEGLEVTAAADGASLRVQPGMAIDGRGQLVVVRETVSLGLPSGLPGPLFVRLRYREDFVEPQRSWSDVDEYTRIVENTIVDVDASPPSEDALELARIAGPSGYAADAANPAQPAAGEIDGRFRRRIDAGVRPRIAITQLTLDGAAEPRHQLGLRFLLREISLSTPYRAHWAGAVQPGEPLPRTTLLYVAGGGAADLDGAAAERLRDLLEDGGAILLDACHDGSPEAFAGWASGLAGALGREPAAVGRWHPLLTGRHVFAEAPLGALSEHGGLILSGSDLGCLWAGGPEGSPAAREAVRAALELGVNAAVYARRRQAPLETTDMDA